MASASRRLAIRATAACALLAIVLVGQAASDALVPEVQRSGRIDDIGRISDSYLGGVKVFVAAVLWNRMEPLMHAYYGHVALADQRYVLPTVALVVTLDPSLYDPYYVGAWIVARNGHVDEGLELARRGVDSNPHAGVLLVSYAQMLHLMKGDLEAAYRYASAALAPDTVWRSLEEQYEGYAVIRDILRANGRSDEAELVQRAMTDLAARIEAGEDAEAGHHDHEE